MDQNFQNNSKQAILIGYSGHSYVVADALISSNYSILGYFDLEELESNPYNLVYLGKETDKKAIEKLATTGFIVAIGSNSIRNKITTLLSAQGLTALNAIHPKSIIATSVKLGNGVMVMAGTVINPFSEIGDSVILNTNCTIEHECKVGAFTHIAPGAVLAGNVTVGENTFVGANSVIIQGITIGSNVTIGAGSVIIADVPNHAKVVGNPGRIIK